jgi:hypothetical protein
MRWRMGSSLSIQAFKPGISKRRRINPLTREEISTLLETAKTMEIDPEIETSLTTVMPGVKWST